MRTLQSTTPETLHLTFAPGYSSVGAGFQVSEIEPPGVG